MIAAVRVSATSREAPSADTSDRVARRAGESAVSSVAHPPGPIRDPLFVGGPSSSPAALLRLQRTVGNRVVSRLLSAPPRGVIRRYLDENDWTLPEEEQTFQKWIEVWWDHDDWISQEHYDEVKTLYDLLVDAQGDEHGARAAYDAAYVTWEANYLEPESDAWSQAVAKGADTVERSGAAIDDDVCAATWPGRNPPNAPPKYADAVGEEIRRRAAAKARAESDAKERDRQERAAAEKAVKDRQTRREWTGKQVVSVCRYGGKTSVHPYWGGRQLMIYQGRDHHFTQFHDNYNPRQVFPAGTDIETLIAAVFGSPMSGDNCLHVTQELFGAKDQRNPRYYISGRHQAAREASVKGEEMSGTRLSALMDDEKQRITNLLRVATTL